MCTKLISGKLQPFVEDIQSNYKLTVQLNGRITRAEAARAEAEQLDCAKTKEVCEQKIKALRAQQLEADRLNSHCQDREVSFIFLRLEVLRPKFLTYFETIEARVLVFDLKKLLKEDNS